LVRRNQKQGPTSGTALLLPEHKFPGTFGTPITFCGCAHANLIQVRLTAHQIIVRKKKLRLVRISVKSSLAGLEFCQF
jgi:hypothetical protein